MDTLRIGSLCTGYGGLDMAVEAAFGARTVWHAQYDPADKHQYAAQILAHHWPDVPNHGDITAIDYAQVEPVDILTAGFPCQDVSLAGKRAGIAPGTRSGLWAHVARAIQALQPRLVVLENVEGLLSAKADRGLEPGVEDLGEGARAAGLLRALGAVLGDLAGLGFDAEWARVAASEVGAAHQRKRVFVLAWPAASNPADLGHHRGRGAWFGWPGLEDRGQSAADTERNLPGHDGELPAGRDALRLGVRDDAPRCGEAAADAAGVGYGDSGPAGFGGLPAAAVAGGASAAADADGRGWGAGEPDDGAGQSDVAWGRYEPAIRRWEHILGRRVPRPTDDRGRLTPAFVEWLMGLPAGHVTAVPGLSRNAQLKALGNGVVPAQAEAAIRLLYARAITPSAAAAA